MKILRLLLLVPLLGAILLVWAYANAVAEPVVRRTDVRLPGLAPGEELRLLLMSDIHVGGPDMPPARLVEIVRRINKLRPDLVLIAGDFVSDKRVATRRYRMAEAIAPLAKLKPRIGAVAVLGNHDHWNDPAAARVALERAGIKLIENDAARAGPLVIGGLDDDFTGRDDLAKTLARMRALGGAPVLLSHSPDPFPEVPRTVPLMLAGHTHCGQIRLPIVGAPTTMSRHGQRYACGRIDEAGRTLIVTAGLGTSMLPLRLGAVPDIWVVTVRASR